MIQSVGVNALIYDEALWYDKSAMMALMREDNANADSSKPETELSAFGTVHETMNQMSGTGSTPTQIGESEIVQKIEEIGFGKTPKQGWQDLVRFRLCIPQSVATMMVDLLFHVCNGRVKSTTANYSRIAALHPKKYYWPKVFMLVEIYCGSLLDEHKVTIAADSQPQLKVINAKPVDPNHIHELSKEKDFLQDVTTFFKDVLRHYSTSRLTTEYDEGKVMYANATLMKALGRTLFKVGDSLTKQEKVFKRNIKNVVRTGPVLDEASNKEKLKVKNDIMHDRLYRIEGKYASALVDAGVFNECSKKPKACYKKTVVDKHVASHGGASGLWGCEPRESCYKKTGCGAASQRDREARDSAESSVTLTASGEIGIATTAGDAARSLGLQGSGVGQLVGVRSSATLLSTGIAFTTTQIKIVQWNPPEVLLAVTGMASTTMTEVVKQIIVGIDDLLPLDKDTKDNESTVDKDPLKRVASVSMQRLPSSCFDSTVKEWMRLSVEQILQIMLVLRQQKWMQKLRSSMSLAPQRKDT